MSHLHSWSSYILLRPQITEPLRGCLMAPFCPHPSCEGRSCAQSLVSSCPHSCPYFPFLVPRCCWLVYGDLQAPGSSSAMLLGHQPLLQVSMSPSYSKDPWLPSHLPLKTDACRLQHPYQLIRYPWSPWGRNSAEPPYMSKESLHHLLLGPRLHY